MILNTSSRSKELEVKRVKVCGCSKNGRPFGAHLRKIWCRFESRSRMTRNPYCRPHPLLSSPQIAFAYFTSKKKSLANKGAEWKSILGIFVFW